MVPSAYMASGTFGARETLDLPRTGESRTYGCPAKHIAVRFTIASSHTKLVAAWRGE